MIASNERRILSPLLIVLASGHSTLFGNVVDTQWMDRRQGIGPKAF